MTLSMKQIDEAITALHNNAKNLIFEAETLFAVKAFARAFTLAHLAREELAKSEILSAAGSRVLMGVTVDWKQTMRRMRDHKSKLELDGIQAVMLSSAGDEGVGNERFNKINIYTSQRNDLKNNSLYVGLDGGVITTPSDVVNEYQAWRTIELAKFSLDLKEKTFELLGAFAKRKPIKDARVIEIVAEINKAIQENDSNHAQKLLSSLSLIYKSLVQEILASDAAQTERI